MRSTDGILCNEYSSEAQDRQGATMLNYNFLLSIFHKWSRKIRHIDLFLQNYVYHSWTKSYRRNNPTCQSSWCAVITPQNCSYYEGSDRPKLFVMKSTCLHSIKTKFLSQLFPAVIVPMRMVFVKNTLLSDYLLLRYLKIFTIRFSL